MSRSDSDAGARDIPVRIGRMAGLPEPGWRPARGDELAAIWAALHSLRETVENDHDHRLRRIETDLRWVIVLLGGQIVALLGAAVAGLLPGG
ncbi:MAG: hypothetical protein V3S18_08225 [Dehalococcoidia bacterium]|jgi:hypothetical protein